MVIHELRLVRLQGTRHAAAVRVADVPDEARVVIVQGNENRTCSQGFVDELVRSLTDGHPDRLVMFTQCPGHVMKYARESAARRGVEDQCWETNAIRSTPTSEDT